MTERRRVKVDDSGMPVRKADVPDESADSAGLCDCPVLDKEEWDGVESDWSDITFLKTTTNAVLGVPVGYNAALADLRKRAAELGAIIPEDAMLLNGAGKFRRPVLLEVDAVAGRDLHVVVVAADIDRHHDIVLGDPGLQVRLLDQAGEHAAVAAPVAA